MVGELRRCQFASALLALSDYKFDGQYIVTVELTSRIWGRHGCQIECRENCMIAERAASMVGEQYTLPADQLLSSIARAEYADEALALLARLTDGHVEHEVMLHTGAPLAKDRARGVELAMGQADFDIKLAPHEYDISSGGPGAVFAVATAWLSDLSKAMPLTAVEIISGSRDERWWLDKLVTISIRQDRSGCVTLVAATTAGSTIIRGMPDLSCRTIGPFGALRYAIEAIEGYCPPITSRRGETIRQKIVDTMMGVMLAEM